jgi:RimJ/RimL family protein N-acetyltransferase
MLDVSGLRLRTPTEGDAWISAAAASDPQAQRWLGWRERYVVPEQQRWRLLNAAAGLGSIPPLVPGAPWKLVAVHLAARRVAGSITVEATGQVGGSLAPRFRGCGLGTRLFAGAAEFAHRHLGFPTVTAGAEPGHAACIAALISAGFVPAAGPDTYTLPNGRVVPSRWFCHESAQPTLCPGAHA